jgi:hypothetical protein
MHLRSQASIEYLLVAGAAILIVALIVVALSGVLGSGKEISSEVAPGSTDSSLWQQYADDKGQYLIQGGTTKYYSYEGDETTLGKIAESGIDLVVCKGGACNDGTAVRSGDIISVSSSSSGGAGNATIPQKNLTPVPEDTTPPVITLISPVDGGEFDTVLSHPELFAYFTGDGVYEGYFENGPFPSDFPEHEYVNYEDGALPFLFNVSDAFGVVKCDLNYNGVIVATDMQAPFEFNIPYSTLKVSPNEEFSWNIACYDAKGNKGISGKRNLFIGQNMTCAEHINIGVSRQKYIEEGASRMCCSPDENIIDATTIPGGLWGCMTKLAPQILCYEGYCGNGICEYPENKCICSDCQ